VELLNSEPGNRDVIPIKRGEFMIYFLLFKYIACHQGTACPHNADRGDGSYILITVANILKIQTRNLIRGGPPVWVVEYGVNN
jgi:hypothetical protein